jgi:cysteine-rich repeat protein
MKIIGRMALLLVACGLAASLVACEKHPEGTLEIHWSINGDESAGACAAAEVTHIRVLVDNTLADTDDNPLEPTWHYEDFACDDGMGVLDLEEGIYRVRIVALRDDVEVRSQVLERLDVQVIDGENTSLPLNPDLEPPLSIEVAVCGDGAQQTGEQCDASDLGDNDCESLGNSGGELLCAADCTFDTSGCLGCGDGTVDPPEECDDGNLDPGDGCSTDCLLEQSALTVGWSLYESDGSTSATCASLGIATVDLSVTVSGVGTLVHSESVGCATGMAVVPDLAYGLYTVTLSGRDATDVEAATGSSAVTDHTDPSGTDLSVDLIGL